MPKINLLKRKKQQMRRKATETGLVFVIAMEQNDQKYYLSEVKNDSGAIVWTHHNNNAMQFHTEDGTQHFIRVFMKGRRDVHIVQKRSKHA